MQKKLHLMSASQLQSFIDNSRELQSMAIGMAANDVKENIKYVLESSTVNEIPENGQVQLNVNSEGTAIIPITGMLTNTVSPSAAFNSKAITTYNFVTESVRLAESNPNVKKILFNPVNSGGGDVDGVEPATIAINNATKPTQAIVHSSAQSAAYLLISGVNKITAVGKMSMFGSIGIAAEFKDRSVAEAKSGEKSIILTSTDAPQKRLDIKTDEGQKSTIKLMDELHGAFASYVVEGRKTTLENVNKNFGRGGTMTAERALAVGMIDEIQGFTTQSASTTLNLAASSTTLTQSTNSGAPDTDITGKISGNSNQKEIMNKELFLAFLETNPEAKAFYETELVALGTQHNEAIATMKTDHETAIETAKTEASTKLEKGAVSVADATRATKLIATGKYPECSGYAAQCFSGAGDFAVLETMIAQSDQFQAKLDLVQTKNNQNTDLEGQEHNLGTKTENDKTTQANAKALAEFNDTQSQVQ